VTTETPRKKLSISIRKLERFETTTYRGPDAN
jgi:hypothetical protein